jgi:uncharacterized Fe-S cluster protein YjdI/CDGSH-type Zn-finger protein
VATRTYENEDLTVFWDSSRCIHTGICLRSLPEVFDLRSRPWVQVDRASADEIVDTVRKCPTGALRYTRAGQPEPAPEETTMIPVRNGPLIVRGRLRVLDPSSGGVIAEETRLALCRCGNSQNEPFCDNSHRRSQFGESAPSPHPGRAEATSPADVCPRQDFVLE